MIESRMPSEKGQLPPAEATEASAASASSRRRTGRDSSRCIVCVRKLKHVTSCKGRVDGKGEKYAPDETP